MSSLSEIFIGIISKNEEFKENCANSVVNKTSYGFSSKG